MAKFHDLVGQLQNPDDGEASAEDIYADLTREYDTAFEGYTSSTETLNNKISEQANEISRLKSTNYDLLMKLDTDDDSESRDKINEDKPISIMDLFRKR